MKKLVLAVFLFSLCSSIGYGQILVDTTIVNKGLGLGPSLSFSQVGYEDKDGNSFTIKRKTLGLGLVADLDGTVGLLAQAGYTFDNDIEDTDFKGNGFMAGIGLNFLMYSGHRLHLLGYGLLNYVSDHFETKNFKQDFEVMDIHFGSLLLLQATRMLGVYGGLDLVPYSDGSLGTKVKTTIKRERIISLKFGLELGLPKAIVKPEITLIGEKTVSLMATFLF